MKVAYEMPDYEVVLGRYASLAHSCVKSRGKAGQVMSGQVNRVNTSDCGGRSIQFRSSHLSSAQLQLGLTGADRGSSGQLSSLESGWSQTDSAEHNSNLTPLPSRYIADRDLPTTVPATALASVKFNSSTRTSISASHDLKGPGGSALSTVIEHKVCP